MNEDDSRFDQVPIGAPLSETEVTLVDSRVEEGESGREIGEIVITTRSRICFLDDEVVGAGNESMVSAGSCVDTALRDYSEVHHCR